MRRARTSGPAIWQMPVPWEGCQLSMQADGTGNMSAYPFTSCGKSRSRPEETEGFMTAARQGDDDNLCYCVSRTRPGEASPGQKRQVEPRTLLALCPDGMTAPWDAGSARPWAWQLAS